MRFAGDAFNKIVRREEPWDNARSAAWKQVRGNRIVDLNNKQIIGARTMPEDYANYSGAYERAIVDLAAELQVKQGMPPISAVAAALRMIDVRDYTQGAPAQASYLQRLAEASRNPSVRGRMDLPENRVDEWGVLMSPVEAIRDHDRMSLNPTTLRRSDGFPVDLGFGPVDPDEWIPF